MDKNKSGMLTEWFNDLASKYMRYLKESKNYRCKLVGCEFNTKTQQTQLNVMISGIKNQIVQFTPQDLVTNDDMLREFSQTDVRAITFYAFQKNESHTTEASICAQEIFCGKTVFIFKHQDRDAEFRKSAHELYADIQLLRKFNFDDLLIILSAAVQEQTIEDMEKVYN